jgi:cytochrome c-type biogenesis protein CcmF
MAIMGAAPYAPWHGETLKKLGKQAWKRMLISIVTALVLLWGFSQHMDVTAALSLSLSIWIIFSVFSAFRVLPGMSLAHLGFAVLVIGIMLSSVLSEQREIRIKPGAAAFIGPYQFFFISTEGVSGSNYRGIRANFEVMKKTRHIVNMYPEKRIYTVRDMVMTKVDIHPGIFRDLYIALGEPLDQDYWSVRLYYKPFMRWIWFGGILMMLGGIVAILQNRKKI